MHVAKHEPNLRNEHHLQAAHLARKPLGIRLMRRAGRLIPGNRLKNAFYFGVIAKPRRLLRQYVNGFYRMEVIYDALAEANTNYEGPLTILEFGTAQGSAFTKMLYAIKYLGMQDRVTAHAFDSFEGMPPPSHAADRDLISDDTWHEGQFAGGFEALAAYCAKHYPYHAFHKGYFQDTITAEFLEGLRQAPPILIWVDCDFYSSARVVLERLLPYIPSGCIVYFDDYDLLNYGSRFSGEARLVHEINHGKFGDDIELVLDRRLSLDTVRCYRFIRFRDGPTYKPSHGRHSIDTVNRSTGRANDSILP